MALFKKREQPKQAPNNMSLIREVRLDEGTPNITGVDFKVRNEVAESIATYIGAYDIKSKRLSMVTNNTAFIRRLVKHVLKYERSYIYKSPTYGWIVTNNIILEGMRAVLTFTLPAPFNSAITIRVPFYDVGVLETTMVDVDTNAADELLEESFNAVIKKLRNTGAIKAFITSDVDMGLDKMAEDAEDKIQLMLDAASKLSGYTFLERGDEVTQMMPDYTTSNVTDFKAMKTFAASQLSVSDKILDGSATDGEKTAVMFRFVEPILKQFAEYEESLEYEMRNDFLVAFATTGGLLNSNQIEGWGKRLENNDKPNEDKSGVNSSNERADANRKTS